MAKQPSALKPFDEAALQEWVERDERRKDLEREARQIKAENDLIAKDLLAAMKANEKTVLERGPYVAAIELKNGTVAWKEEFLRLAGSAEAERLASSVPQKETLAIRKRI